MSLDYPFYEKLVQSRHPAAIWWRLGDTLYYLGLFTAVLSLTGLAMVVVLRLLGQTGLGGAWALWLGLSFCTGITVFAAGSIAKGHSYVLAARDGITESDQAPDDRPRS